MVQAIRRRPGCGAFTTATLQGDELAQMPLLKLKEAQRYSNLSRAELLAAIEAEELKATKGGGEWKIRREALEEYIRKNF